MLQEFKVRREIMAEVSEKKNNNNFAQELKKYKRMMEMILPRQDIFLKREI